MQSVEGMERFWPIFRGAGWEFSFVCRDRLSYPLPVHHCLSEQSIFNLMELQEIFDPGNALICQSDIFYPNCDSSLKPFVGKKIQTEEDGISFYTEYARVAGFDIRRGSIKKSADGKNVLWRYMFCNREGEKNVKNVTEENAEDGNMKNRRRVSRRNGCMARMVLKFCGAEGYVVEYFIDEHNHPLLSEIFKPFMKVNRNIDFFHEKFVLDCARSAIGPVKSFRLFKEMVGPYSAVGCLIDDFKKVSRGLKAYVDGFDAQMILDQLCRKRDLYPSYVFDFEVDAQDRLTRLFWCDPISRKNYGLFGDIVSFDATYSTNRYNMIFTPFTGKDNHGRCVTFGAGLLSKEDAESYIWILEKFKKCMGSVPSLIVTDQDLGMKVAIERVFAGTRHRFCMWHIMLKVADKVPQVLKKDDDFKKKLCGVVWSELIEPEEFECGWAEIMKEFDLIGDKWFVDMYELRHFWIPAYFRDFPMSGLIKTTSISESENSVFGRYTRSRDNLVEFFMHYECAIDAQRHANAELNYIDEVSLNKVETRLMFEKHAASIYTHQIFKDVQKQILSACFSCSVLHITNEGDVHEYTIDDGHNNKFRVLFNAGDLSATSSWKMFVRVGLLCAHIFFIFKNVNLKSIPDKFIVGRWTKKPGLKFTNGGDVIFDDPFVASDEKKRLSGKLLSELYHCIGIVDGNLEMMNDLMIDILALKEKYTSIASLGHDKQSILERFYGASVPEDVGVLPPNEVKTKGSGSRLQSRKEKAIREANKPPRRCSKCQQMTNHDARNCDKFTRIAEENITSKK